VAFANDLEHLARHYEGYRRLLERWAADPPLRSHVVRNEQLVSDPEGGVRALLALAGLEWEPRCLRFHERRRSVATASSHAVRQPMHGASVGRWRGYAAHLGPLARLVS